MSTAQEIILDAYINLGKIEVGQTLQSTQLAHGLRRLNQLIGSLSKQHIVIPQRTRETATLLAGYGSHTISTKPLKVESAFIRDSANYDHHLREMSQGEYSRISDKTNETGRPRRFYYEPTIPTGTMFYDKVATETETVHLVTLRPFTSFISTSDNVNLDDGYERMLGFNLAIDLAASLKMSVPNSVALNAQTSLDEIKSYNNSFRIPVSEVDGALAGTSGYNINEG